MSRESAQALAGLTPTPSPIAGANPEVVSQTLAGEPGLIPAPEGKPADLDSTRFAHLAKKEAALVRDREMIKKQQQEIASARVQADAVLAKQKQFDDFKSKGDALSALKAFGYSDTDILNLFAQTEDNSTPEQKAEKAAQKVIDDFKVTQAKERDEAQKIRNTEVLGVFRRDIDKAIKQDTESFKYCNFYDAEANQLIEETVTAVLTESGGKELIPIKEAAEMVETFYRERDEAMAALRKKKEDLVVQPEPEAPLRAQVSQRPSAAALSSRANATVASTVTTKRESSSEKRERLIQKLASLGKQ